MSASDGLAWTDPMREALIENFHKNECLWNLTDMDYRNVSKKRYVLCEIAKNMSQMFDMQITVDHVSRQWQSLRDQYRRAKKKTSGVNQKPWRFLHSLKFTDTENAENGEAISSLFNSLLWEDGGTDESCLHSSRTAQVVTPNSSALEPEGDRNAYPQPVAYEKTEGGEIFSVSKEIDTGVPSALSATLQAVGNVTVTCSPSVSHEIACIPGRNSRRQPAENLSCVATVDCEVEQPSQSGADVIEDIPYEKPLTKSAETECWPSRKRASNSPIGYAPARKVIQLSSWDFCDDYALFGRTVERKLRSIAARSARHGLILQKKITDCLFDVEMELLEAHSS